MKIAQAQMPERKFHKVCCCVLEEVFDDAIKGLLLEPEFIAIHGKSKI